MNIIFLGKFRGKPVRLQLSYRWHILCLSLFILAVSGIILKTGYWWGDVSGRENHLIELEQSINQQQAEIDDTRLNAQSDLDALAARIGKMNAHMIRVNALGQRLVKITKLDSREFNFKNDPPLGGPHRKNSNIPQDFNNILGLLNEQLEDREKQLEILELVLINSSVKKETSPTGKPIGKGWVSSYFGKRNDPFTGKLSMHDGMDFAGKEGSDVNAVAGGVITWSGPRYGYGNLIEINHGNGYTTRYGHNGTILVKVGDAVNKGQVISTMGSTGRSTGPHVHFEVLLNGRQIDPTKFVLSKS